MNGLILAGGESSRMGKDKSLLDFHGTTQREYLFNMLAKFCQDVYLSCRTADNVPANLNPLTDKFSLKSPLNGILSAFKHDASTAWLSVPVDMPNINEKIIDHLIANRHPEKMATCYYDSDGENPEPLFAIWEAHAYPALMAYYEKGKTTPRGFLQTHDVAVLRSPNPEIHLNINFPEDLTRYHKGKITPDKE